MWAGMQDLACQQPDVPACMALQETRFRALEQQRGTLLGLIGSNAVAEIEGRPSNPLYGGLHPSVTTMQPYLGQSGKLVGVKAAKDSNNLFVGSEVQGWPPEKLLIAELDQVGCFYTRTYSGPDGYGHFHDDGDLEPYRNTAENSRITLEERGTDAWRAWLRKYVEQRDSMLLGAYNEFGVNGVRSLQRTYASPEHAAVIELLREEATKPAFTNGMSNMERAEVRSLVRNPDRFLPCQAVQHGV
jgi:hypothetical protein